MDRTAQPLIVIAICLAALAGFVDALAFTSLGGFFASFMSGNSTRLGVGLGATGLGEAAMAGALVMSFVSGVIVATVILRARPGRHRESVMLVVTALLAAAATLAGLAPGPVALLLLASAMGAAHLLFDRMFEAAGGAAGLTGTLVRAGERLAGALMGDADRWGWLAHFLPWIGFVAGVVLGAGGEARLGIGAWWIAAAASAVVTLRLAMLARRAAGTVEIAS